MQHFQAADSASREVAGAASDDKVKVKAFFRHGEIWPFYAANLSWDSICCWVFMSKITKKGWIFIWRSSHKANSHENVLVVCLWLTSKIMSLFHFSASGAWRLTFSWGWAAPPRIDCFTAASHSETESHSGTALPRVGGGDRTLGSTARPADGHLWWEPWLLVLWGVVSHFRYFSFSFLFFFFFFFWGGGGLLQKEQLCAWRDIREARWVRGPGSDRTPMSPVRTEPDGPQKRLGES